MDLFKSVFSADQDPSKSYHDHEDDQQQRGQEEDEASPNPNTVPNEASGSWSFGGMMKTFATRSESMIQTYRRDLEEFGSGLKKETEAIKEVASRAVRDLPGSLETGASIAHCSLESVWKGTASIISHSKDAFLAAPDPEAISSRRHSRFEAQVLAVQNDPNTFVEAPEDTEDFDKWKLGFRMEEKEEEIEVLLYENGVLEGFYEKFVPGVVDFDSFWTRYFYKVYKLQLAEAAREKLVKSVTSTKEEELSWEDDDQNDAEKENIKEEENKNVEEELTNKEIVGTLESIDAEKHTEEEIAEDLPKPTEESTKTQTVGISRSQVASKDENSEKKENAKSEIESSKAPAGAKSEPAEDDDEDDLDWDDIENLNDHDDKKVGRPRGSPRKENLRKRLSVAVDDEDLSWDVEDEGESPKTRFSSM